MDKSIDIGSQIDKNTKPVGASNTKKGLSIIVVTYKRAQALRQLLNGLLKQDLKGIKTELIIINNDPAHNYSTSSAFSRISILLHKFQDIKIINSSYNWGPGIRYIIALAASYENILFFDDDIYPTDPKFIKSMFFAFKKLRPIDMLTCWAEIWLKWSKNNLTTVPVHFLLPEIDKITQVDYAGTGISMFNKKILSHQDILRFPMEYPFADTAWFPWMPTILFGTRKYYFPSYGMLKFHEEKEKGALCLRPGYDDYILKKRKFMLKQGYKPVLTKRFPKNSPEQEAIKRIPVVVHKW